MCQRLHGLFPKSERLLHTAALNGEKNDFGGLKLFKISKLSNGIRVVTEKIDYVRSVSAGVWIGAGSAMENAAINGVSHFIEHMLFKGTETRSARDIAEFTDRVGGQLNAVTAKEYTCFYAKTLTEHYEMSLDILSDMIIRSTFSEDNINTERRVIAEEINMCDDSPEDWIHDRLSEAVWQSDPLGYPIAGTVHSIDGIDRKAMLAYRDRFYRASNMVISVVGSFDETELFQKLEKYFGGIPASTAPEYAQKKLTVSRGIGIFDKDTEQCHMCMGLEGVDRNDKNLYDLLIINALLGGNMSSRLFQRVREDAGLAYSIYSYANTYINNGSWVLYAGLNTDSLCQAAEIINSEIKRLKRDKLTREEIDIAKEQMKAYVIMGIESMSGRMSSYGKSLLFDNAIKTPEDIITDIERVTVNSAADMIERIFDSSKLNLVVSGRIEKSAEDIAAIMDF